MYETNEQIDTLRREWAEALEIRLEDWELHGNRMYGNVYNNPKFEDGTSVITSTIKEIGKLGLVEGGEVTTQNSVYKLGKPFGSM